MNEIETLENSLLCTRATLATIKVILSIAFTAEQIGIARRDVLNLINVTLSATDASPGFRELSGLPDLRKSDLVIQ